MLTTINSILTNQDIPQVYKSKNKNIYGIYKRLEQGHKLSDIQIYYH